MPNHNTQLPGHSAKQSMTRGMLDISAELASSNSESTDTARKAGAAADLAVAARAYQTEMYEKSLKNNIIVVMDTGSGKTLVATLRIKHELASIDIGKRVWFLTPTVQLCQQQCRTLQQQIRSVEIRSFSSRDKVELWRTRELWDAALANVRVAVGTYAVLQNALSDGFVTMGSIALIVFDEAHNCVGKSPGSKIMNDFYWRDKAGGRLVPRILGLTASPTNEVGGAKLKKLEDTLDATCKSPRIHRECLQSHVSRPTVSIEYYPTIASNPYCRSIASMQAILAGLDIHRDPDIIRYKTENTEKSRAKLKSALKTGNTFVLNQLRTFCTRAEAMSRTLGTLAADFYIAKVASLFDLTAPLDQSTFWNWNFSSLLYLAKLLSRVEVDRGALTKVPSMGSISPKVECLVRILCSHHKGENGSRGIVFVTERATIVVVHHLLSQHPSIKRLFRVGSVVGSSIHDRGRRDLGDIFNPADQSKTIEKFHSGEVNLLVATSVLEEGIDVSACNLVVCFDPPLSPKSFIQRRGRARKADSKYFILIDEDSREKAEDWEDIEEQLKAEYDREDRATAVANQTACRETSDRMFIHPTTSAVLDMENAKGRLQHFCAVIGSRRYANKQPYYVFQELESQLPTLDGEPPLRRAKVVLPLSVPYQLRITWSTKAWRSERNASKDAAFEAYMGLYRAELVNDNLQPLTYDAKSHEDLLSMIEIREQFDPWDRIGRASKRREAARSYNVVVQDGNGETRFSFEMTVPADIAKMAPFQFFSGDKGEMWRVRLGLLARAVSSDAGDSADHTATSATGYQLSIKDRQQQRVVSNAPWNLQMPLAPSCPLIPLSLQQNNTRSKSAPVHATLCQLVPHILYKIEARLVAQELQKRILSDESNDVGGGKDLGALIRSAITVPARGEAEYQSLEFLGDACLKLLITVFFTTKYPLWPQGYLTDARAKVISNTRLCQAALERELDQFILMKPLDAEAWLTACLDNTHLGSTSRVTAAGNDKPCHRQIARRTLAHTVKALIGAGRQAGGYGTALAWTKRFLGEVDLPSLEVGRLQIFDLSPRDMALPKDLCMTETLAGYSFRKKSLLIEALTHSSDLTATRHSCYDRLAFLGNAVIESIVSDAIYDACEDKSFSSHGMMSRYRAAMVNRHYLGYVALDWHVSQTRATVQQTERSDVFTQESYSVDFALWRFLKHCSPEMTAEMSAMEARFAESRRGIRRAVESGRAYPWLLLVQLQVNEFYADIVESLVGAIFVDSGSMELCEEMLDRMGVLLYLRRIMRDRVDVVHPKERLQVLAGKDAVRYEVKKGVAHGKERGLTCAIYVGDTLVAQVEGGLGEDEVQIKAAVEAIATLAS